MFTFDSNDNDNVKDNDNDNDKDNDNGNDNVGLAGRRYFVGKSRPISELLRTSIKKNSCFVSR